MHDTLNQLTRSLTEIATKIRDRNSHRLVLDSLAAAFKSHLDEKRAELRNKRASRRSTLRQSISSTPKPEQQTPPAHDYEEVQSLENLLRRLGISLPALLASSSPSKPDEVLDDRKERMAELLETYQLAAESPISSALESADSSLQLLLSSLHADSVYSVSLTEKSYEQRLEALENQIITLRRGIDGPVLDSFQQADKMRDRFVERWS